MVEVIATTKGYFGGVVRDVGERFVVPDDLWKDAKRRPKWVKPATGVPAPASADDPKKKGGRGKEQTLEAPAAEPFADAPPPETIGPKGNGVQEALGTTAPDWVDPSAPQPVSD